MPHYNFLAAILSVCYRNNWACDVSWDFLSNGGPNLHTIFSATHQITQTNGFIVFIDPQNIGIDTLFVP